MKVTTNSWNPLITFLWSIFFRRLSVLKIFHLVTILMGLFCWWELCFYMCFLICMCDCFNSCFMFNLLADPYECLQCVIIPNCACQQGWRLEWIGGFITMSNQNSCICFVKLPLVFDRYSMLEIFNVTSI